MIVLVVTGSRRPNPRVTAAVCESLGVFRERKDVMVIQGGANGADRAALEFGEAMGWIVVTVHYVKALGRKGGPVRNDAMAELAEGMRELGHDVYCYAFPRPDSTGTVNARKCLKAREFDVETTEVP